MRGCVGGDLEREVEQREGFVGEKVCGEPDLRGGKEEVCVSEEGSGFERAAGVAVGGAYALFEFGGGGVGCGAVGLSGNMLQLLLEFSGGAVGAGAVVFAVDELGELEVGAFEAAEGVTDVEVVAETLHDEVFGREDGFGGDIATRVGGEFFDVFALEFGFCGEEEGGAEDVLDVVGHGRIVEVESAQVLYACCLHRPVSFSSRDVDMNGTHNNVEPELAVHAQLDCAFAELIHDAQFFLCGQAVYLCAPRCHRIRCVCSTVSIPLHTGADAITFGALSALSRDIGLDAFCG